MAKSKAEEVIQCNIIKEWKKIDGQKYSILFAVPNGGSRHKLEAINLKRSGVLAGVSDLILATHKGQTVYIEVKKPEIKVRVGTRKNGNPIYDKLQDKGTQLPTQIEFEKKCAEFGHKYHIVYSVDDFIKVYNTYI
jgi:hypothetical protein